MNLWQTTPEEIELVSGGMNIPIPPWERQAVDSVDAAIEIVARSLEVSPDDKVQAFFLQDKDYCSVLLVHREPDGQLPVQEIPVINPELRMLGQLLRLGK